MVPHKNTKPQRFYMKPLAFDTPIPHLTTALILFLNFWAFDLFIFCVCGCLYG